MPKKPPSKPTKKSRGDGAERHEARQRRLEQRRQSKAEERARQMRQKRRERFVRFMVWGLIVAAFVWFIFLRNQTPTEINGHTISQFSTAGTNQHTDDPVTYEVSPPVSGQHAPQAQPCGIYGDQIANENQVHMLEHGAIGVQYQPTLDPAQIEEIETLVATYDENVYSAPYSEMETPIAITSWSRMMKLDTFDRAAVREYIDTFAGKGPEPDQTCPSEVDNPFEPVPTESPAASPAPSPTDDGKQGKKGKGSGGG